MYSEMNELINRINDDYVYDVKGSFPSDAVLVDVISEFINGCFWQEDQKYFKVITGRYGVNAGRAWGFVVKADDDSTFDKGDILRAKSWSNPFLNKSRGNIFCNYEISWMGP